jgi:hypothetical protein
MTTATKLRLAWKYRAPLWKYRKLIQHRKKIAAGAFAIGAVAVAAVVLIGQRSKD